MGFTELRSICFILLVSLSIASCKETATKQTIETPEISFTKEGELQVFRTENDSILARLDIEIADSDYETQTGLMYRSGMADNQAMLFIFEDNRMHSFYMKNTEFPLDILFVDEDLKIVSYKENAQPLDESGISSEYPIRYVLEVNAGLTKASGISVGDSISFSRQ